MDNTNSNNTNSNITNSNNTNSNITNSNITNSNITKRKVTPGGGGGGKWIEGRTKKHANGHNSHALTPNAPHPNGFFADATPVEKAGALKRDFFYVPSTLLSAREGWWQDRKRRWIALGIRSELGRGAAAGGSPMPGQRKSDAENYGGQATVDRLERQSEERKQLLGHHKGGSISFNTQASLNRVLSKTTTPNGNPTVDSLTFHKGGTGNDTSEVTEKILEVAEGGTSIFDPVLCEILYRWFCPPEGKIIDPFAGGSVRGIVASALWHPYTGIDLAELQIVANQLQWTNLQDIGPAPNWIAGDSNTTLNDPTFNIKDNAFDFLISCPPYADLEVYSDDPRDISNKSYDDFLFTYTEIIAKACDKLKPNRFAAFVVGDARGPDGAYYGFPEDTVKAFQKAGLQKYNELILVTAMGSAAIRARMGFASSRKVVKTHQNILVFIKGDPKRATRAIEGPKPVTIPEPIMVGRGSWPNKN